MKKIFNAESSELEELRRIVEAQKTLLKSKDEELAKKDEELAKKDEELARRDEKLAKNSVEIVRLKSQIEYLLRNLYGHKSEKVVIDDSQPVLFDIAGDAETGEEKSDGTNVVGSYTRKATKHDSGWNDFPDSLPVEDVYLELPPEQVGNRKVIGEEISKRLVKRVGYVVRVIHRKKYANPNDALETILVAPAPKLPKCLYGESGRCHYDTTVVANVISRKIVDHLPFDRQSQIMSRMDIRCSTSVMCDWFEKIAIALEPLYNILVKRILECPVIHADETSLKMQALGKTMTCWMWVRMTGIGKPLTAFFFADNRAKSTAIELLGSYYGTIIRDGYAAYGDLPAEAAGCWAHCRRKFFEAQRVHGEFASRALALVQQLYKYEDLARNKDDEKRMFRERKTLRRDFSASVVDKFFNLCKEIVLEVNEPRSPIQTAATYALAREKELRVFLHNPMVNIDNNPCENAIRPMCVGRKNWLFVGNQEAGMRLAIFESFAMTCKNNGVNFEQWLLKTINAIDSAQDEDQLEQLLP